MTTGTTDIGIFVRRSLDTRLREQYPYMKTAKLESMVEEAGSLVDRRIEEQHPQMRETKSRISFFSLSAELRNNIYEMILSPDSEEDVRIEIPRCSRPKVQMPERPALLETSKQVRAETLPMYYNNKKFLAFYKNRTVMHADHGLKEWLDVIGPAQAAMIKRLTIKFDNGKSDMSHLIRNKLRSMGLKARSIQDRDNAGIKARAQPARACMACKEDVLLACDVEVPGVRTLRNAEVKVVHRESGVVRSPWVELR